MPVFIEGEVETGLERLGFALGQQVTPCKYVEVVSYLSGG